MIVHICHLYPDLLNIYGDRGNIITLVNRCQWRGIEVKVAPISIGHRLMANKYDLYFGGGGQDRQQLIVSQDLQKKALVLKKEAARGVPMLTICGTYQLFGHYFKTHENTKIPGISIFDAYTIASYKRKIGNVVVRLNKSLNTGYWLLATKLVGFENHSGNTFISQGVKRLTPLRCDNLNTSTLPLGKVVKGFGNNGKDKTEGAVYKNVIGTYLHGPVLPKNPHLADWLIKTALEIKYQKEINLEPLDDSLEWQAHKAVLQKSC